MVQRRFGLTVLAMLTALAGLSATPGRAGPELVVGPARQGETTAYRITSSATAPTHKIPPRTVRW